jgi:hypothetical protein
MTSKQRKTRCITLKNYVIEHQDRAARLLAKGWTVEARTMFTAKLRVPTKERGHE